MKKLLSLVLLLGILSNFVYAEFTQKEFNQSVRFVMAAEKSGDYARASIYSALKSREILKDIKNDESIMRVETFLYENQEEVIANSRSQGGSLSGIFGFVSGSGHQRIETTKILTTNSEEVRRFGAKKEREFRKLKNDLEDYVREHSSSIFYAKAFAAKALQLATKTSESDFKSLYPLITKVAQEATVLSFKAEQEIVSCLSIYHPARSTNNGLSLDLLIFSLSFTDESQALAYEETSCDGTISRNVEVTDENASAMFGYGDYLIDHYARQLSLKALLQEAPTYPSWGLPYFN